MKQSLAILNLVVILGGIGVATMGRAQNTGKAALPTPVVRALQAVQENAQAARDNAAIYQWTRVNREVDRIAADMRKVEQALDSDTSRSKRVEALRTAVGRLRAARLAHDVARIQDAAAETATLSADLLKD